MNTRYFAPKVAPKEFMVEGTKVWIMVGALKPSLAFNVMTLALKTLWRFDDNVLDFQRDHDEKGLPLATGTYPETDDEELFIRRNIFNENYGTFRRILACSQGEGVTLDILIDLAIDEPETIVAIYAALVELNPKLALDYKEGPQAQAVVTRTDLGAGTIELKPEAELAPLG